MNGHMSLKDIVRLLASLTGVVDPLLCLGCNSIQLGMAYVVSLESSPCHPAIPGHSMALDPGRDCLVILNSIT